MADVWLAILNRFVEKYLNVKGGPTVVDFDSQVQLTVPVLIGAEERYHQGWSRFAFAIGVTGAAGQSAAVMLHNPLTSNAIAVVERLGVRSTAAAVAAFTVSFQPGPAGIGDFGTAVTPLNMDGRSTIGSSMIVTSSTAGAPFARNLFNVANINQLETQVISYENQELTLIPGSALIALDTTLGDTGIFHITWRERPLELSELT